MEVLIFCLLVAAVGCLFMVNFWLGLAVALFMVASIITAMNS